MQSGNLKNPKNMKKPQKNASALFAIFFVGLITFALLQPREDLVEVNLSSVVQRANNDEIAKVTTQGDKILVTKLGEEKASEFALRDATTSLIDYGFEQPNPEVEFDVKSDSNTGALIGGLLLNFLPLIIIIGFFLYMMKQAQGQGNQAMNFGKSRARLFGSDKENIVFSDVAGAAEAKEELEEIVEFLKFPKKFSELGAKIPKGVLLYGPPGTGKTLMARAVAGEAGVPFFSISGSEFVEMFVGVGASRVRDLFSKAKKNSPCIIFIDEIDAVGRRRGSGMGGGHDEREQTLNQILVEMDGFEQGTNVIVIAATNRSDVLDPALLRPGRFDRRVTIDLPDRKDREAILKTHLRQKPVSKDVDLDKLAAKTAGTSGADLANIINEAAINAARNNEKQIANKHLDNAFEKVAIGPERKSKVMSEHEKELTAYHEAGHTVVGHVLPLSDPIHKVTIVSRGRAGGVTWALPPEDKSYHSINEFKDVLARVLGGRVAEKVIYGGENVTTGAGSDLKKATELARDMIVGQGMGDGELRDMVFDSDENDGLMFDRMMHDRTYSEKTAQTIDAAVSGLIKEAAERAEIVIKENLSHMKLLAKDLLEKESLDEHEIAELLKDTHVPEQVAL